MISAIGNVDSQRIATVARQHPNFTEEQRLAVLGEIQSELHPLWKTLSWSKQVSRVAHFAKRLMLSLNAPVAPLSVAPFLGNETIISNPSGGFTGLQRQSDCSLTRYNGAYTVGVPPSIQVQTSAPNFERVLHAAAGLSTRAGVFAKGCVDPTLGIGSRRAVYLGRTSQGFYLGAAEGYDRVAGSNALYYGTIDPSTQAVHGFNTDLSQPGIAGLAEGDLNGDGLADIVGLDSTSASINVWLAKPDGTISAATSYSLPGNKTEAAVMADVNGDGKVDVVVATRSTAGQEQISVLTGKGDGTLNAAQSFSVGTPLGHTITNLIAGDIRASGHPDIVASNGVVLLNNGLGTLTVGAPAFTPETATSASGPNLVAGDFNNDNKLDLAVGNGVSVHIYLGGGDGTFTAGKSYASISDIGYLTATDLDGDGNIDLYVGLANGGYYGGDQSGGAEAYALMGDGDGTFQGAPSLPFQYTGNNLVDLNGDKIVDAVGVNSDGSFTSYLGDGKGGFSIKSTLSTSPVTISGQSYIVSSIESFAIGDVNGDGIPDLAYIGVGIDGFNGPGSMPGVFIALGNGQGGFAAPSFHFVPSTLTAGDFDINWTISNLHLADLNHDAKADLIYNYSDTSNRALTTYFGTIVQLGSGNGAFQTPQVIPYRSAAYSSIGIPTETAYVQSITDLNRDGIPDLIFIAQSPNLDHTLATYAASVQVALGRGDGTFSTPTSVAGADIMVQSFTDVIRASIAVGDMNGDGIPDIVSLGSSSSYNTQVAVSIGNGDGTFKAPLLTNYSAQYLNNAQGIAVADFDGDGKLDVAITDPYSLAGSGISLGKGDGTLRTSGGVSATQPSLAIYIQSSGAAMAADFNGDGKPDLLAGNTLLLGQAATTAASITTLTSSANSLAVGQALSLTAMVAAASGITVPTGTATFVDGYTALGSVALDGAGKAMFTTSSLAAGAHTLSASYGGDMVFATSTSPNLTVQVTATADFGVSASPNSGTAIAGQQAQTTVTITPTNGFNQSVSMTCSGLPNGASCKFSPASISINGTSATSALSIGTTARTAMNAIVRPFNPLMPGGLLLAGLGLPLVLRRRTALLHYLGLLAFLLISSSSMQGCQKQRGSGSGSGSSNGTPAGTYAVTISATGGSTTHTIGYTLTIR